MYIYVCVCVCVCVSVFLFIFRIITFRSIQESFWKARGYQESEERKLSRMSECYGKRWDNFARYFIFLDTRKTLL